MNDNATMMKELQSLHTSDESITASINETKRELKVNEEELAEMEINKKAFEKQLHRENENLQNGLLKAQSEDQKTIRIIQQLRNEAENLRMEELYEQDTFSSNKIQWNQKIKEEQNKLKELKKKETTMETTTIREEESELWLNANHSRSSEQSAQNFTARNKRKSISSHSNKIAKQMKPNTDDEDSDDDDNVSLIINI